MKRIASIAFALAVAASVQAQVIDTFSGDLSAYTATRILNNGPHATPNTYAWGINNGSLQLETTAYVGIEQFALTRTDYTLGVGYELTATFSAAFTGTQDIGLYVGTASITPDVRQNYVNVYRRNNGQLFSRGFNGTTEFALGGGSTPANVTSLFVARTATDIFELGFYDGTTRNIVSTRTISGGNAAGIGNSLGFYADVRAAGIVGGLDNLTISLIPEPTSASLLGFGLLGAIFRMRRKN